MMLIEGDTHILFFFCKTVKACVFSCFVWKLRTVTKLFVFSRFEISSREREPDDTNTRSVPHKKDTKHINNTITRQKHVNHPLACENFDGPEIAREEFTNVFAVHAENDGQNTVRTEKNERQSAREYFRSLVFNSQP